MSQIRQISYQVGGSLASQSSSYIQRQADTELYSALTAGELCYVLNARQMGKSSLLVQTRNRLQQAGYRCSVIDITNIGSENITPVQWYTGLVYDLWRGFKLLRQVKLSEWKVEEREFSFLQRLSHFISDVLLKQFPDDNLVIFIDEIDSILSLPFPVDDFFALIRFCYNQRAIDPAYRRLNFALFGVATPSDLIRDRTRTPFNIGHPIELSGFTYAQAKPLAQGLDLEQGNPSTVLKAILSWTNGQPFLTQKLCQLVVEQGQQTAHGQLMIPAGNEAFWVESLVRNRLIQNWETKDEPEHLRTIRNRILSNPDKSGRLLGIYQQVLQGEPVLSDDSPEQTDLLLSGLVIKEGQQLRVKNPIYAAVFDAAWVAHQLSNLRPYSQSLKAWVASERTDGSRLLRGQALVDAQQWSQGKQLSDLDYQYLATSVESDRAAAQKAMQAEQLQVKLQQEQHTARLQRRFLSAVSVAFLSAVGFGAFTLWQSRQVRLSEIQALAAAAAGNFDSDRQLQAMYQGIQAKTAADQMIFPPPQSLTQQIETVLDSLVDRTDAVNKIEIGTSVRSLAVHPDGDLIAVVGADGKLTYWKPSGASADVDVATVEGVAAAAFSPDGERVAIATEDRSLQVWQMDGTLLSTVENLLDNLRDLYFSADSEYLKLSTATRNATLLHIGNNGTGARVVFEQENAHPMLFNQDENNLIAYHSPTRPPGVGVITPRTVDLQPLPQSPQSRTGATNRVSFSAGVMPRLVLVDVAGNETREFVIGASPVFSMAVSPDGQYIALARVDGKVELWSPEGDRLKTFFGHTSKAGALAFSANGQQLASADSDGVINLWQLDGSLLKTFSGHEADVDHLVFDPAGNWLASSSDDGTVRLWQLQPPLHQTLAAHTDAIHALTFISEGQQLLSLAVDQSAKVWQRSEAQTFESSPAMSYGSHNSHHGSTISPDHQLIAKIHFAGRVQLMQVDGTVTQNIESGHVGGIAFSTDGQRLIMGGRDRDLKIWQQQPDGQFALAETWDGHDSPISAIATAPGGNLTASGALDHSILLWTNGEITATLDDHNAEITALTFSPDGQWLASGSADNTVRLWRPDGTLVHTLSGHNASIRAIAFSPDSSLLVSASTDGTLRVWQPEQPTPLVRTLTGHRGYLTSVTFSPDGELIASAGVDRRIVLWRINEILQVNPLNYACQWLGDYLQHSPAVDESDRKICEG